jgi:hypothetical protein
MIIVHSEVEQKLIESTKAMIADEIKIGTCGSLSTLIERLEQRLKTFTPTPYFDYVVMLGQESDGEQTVDVGVKFNEVLRFFYFPMVISNE